MSLPALSTELDDRIVSFLEHKAINAISKVSRYYHRVAEPHLYHTLEFKDNQHLKSLRLLLTIVSRPKLAAYITILRLTPANRRQHLDTIMKDEHLYTRLRDRLQDIQKALQDTSKSPPPKQLLSQWLSAITHSQCLHGCLAYIVGQAVNLEDLSIYGSDRSYHGPFMFNALEGLSLRLTGNTSNCTPKLTRLDVRCHSYLLSVLVLPWLRSLIIRECDDVSFGYSFLSQGQHASLQTLHPERIFELDLDVVCELLSSGRLSSLTSLSLVDMTYDTDYDLQYLFPCLRESCPKLKVLELLVVNVESLNIHSIVKGLEKLHNLKKLRTDLGLLTGYNFQNIFFEPAQMLQPQLEQLHLSNFGCDLLLPFFDPPAEDPNRKDGFYFIQRLADTLPLKEMSIGTSERNNDLDHNCVLPSETKQNLKRLCASLANVGVNFSPHKELRNGEVVRELETRLLVDASYTSDD
jgi:hypothetical protein